MRQYENLVVNLQKELAENLEELHYWVGDWPKFVPPGHFYSPIPSMEEIKSNENRIFGKHHLTLPGIKLNQEEQLELLNCFQEFYKEMPFPEYKKDSLRYYMDNPFYGFSDAIFLYCMLRYLQPKRVIEIGSGYSSCATLDVNELFFDNSIECTFIEPYPDSLKSLIREDDKNEITILEKKLQDVDLSLFSQLSERDILFIDSTHISKVNSDVNYIFFKILPSLRRGVFIHFHDIFYPFEYPRDWFDLGIAFNEDYILRAFLQYNSAFKIVFFNTYLEHFHEEWFLENMPLCLKNKGGSIWLQKI